MSAQTSGDALVLGGGGVAGIAWTTGLLTGLADAGNDVSGAGLVIGTSAGASVAGALASRLTLPELYARQVDPEQQTPEISADLDLEAFAEDLAPVVAGAGSAREVRRAIGRLALSADTVSEDERRAVVAARLPSHDWPGWDLRIVAVDARSGKERVFTRDDGVGLVDAVAASCAVPGVWPPVTIGDHRYVDGGVRSSDNADLAAGAERVLVVSPLGSEAPSIPGTTSLADMVAALRRGGSAVAVVVPDAASREAFGTNPLDPSTRAVAARAGRDQGQTQELDLR